MLEKIKKYGVGFKSLLNRNVLLICLLQCAFTYGNRMRMGFRTFVVTKDLGLTPAIFGAATSIFMIFAFISRTPVGALIDDQRKKIKYYLACVLVLCAVTWMGFSVIKNQTGMYILFIIDGMLWGAMMTIPSALLSVSVDRSVMGTAVSLMSALQSLLTSTGTATGINLYNEKGIFTACLVAAGCALLAAVLALFIDSDILVARFEETPNAGKKQKVSIIEAFKDPAIIKLLPLMVLSCFPIVVNNVTSSYVNVHGQDMGFSYLSYTTLANAISSFMNIAIGILCDIVPPAIVLVFMLIGQTVGPFLWGFAKDSATYGLGIVLIYMTRTYSSVFQLMGKKVLPNEKIGLFSGTIQAFADAISIICGVVLGNIATAAGYANLFKYIGFWMLFAFVAYMIFFFTGRKELERMAEEKEKELEAKKAAE